MQERWYENSRKSMLLLSSIKDQRIRAIKFQKIKRIKWLVRRLKLRPNVKLKKGKRRSR
jgi:hypothetical protein